MHDTILKEFMGEPIPSTFEALEKHITSRGFKYTSKQAGERTHIEISDGVYYSDAIYNTSLHSSSLTVCVVHQVLQERMRRVTKARRSE